MGVRWAWPSCGRLVLAGSSRLGWLALLIALTTGCDESTTTDTAVTPVKADATPKVSGETKTWKFPAADRVVAIGDVHGDFKATRDALRIGGLIDGDDKWIGGKTVLVQTGDMLDRGDDEQRIVDFLTGLKAQAAEVGGTVHLLQGNHELMNVAGDFRYVTPCGFADFEDVPGLNLQDPKLSRLPRNQRARAAAWLPGGVYATKVAKNPVAVVVGDTVFAHGGVLPKYAADLERINREVTAWALGQATVGRRHVASVDGPLWSRHFSDEPDASDCKLLAASLSTLGAKRMVVGHTVQPKIRPACDQRVWRVDVGMAAHYGGRPEVLEIKNGSAKPLASAPP